MPHIVTMAAVMANATDATLADWHVSVGDKLAQGAVFADVETEKATIELECDAAGIVRHMVVAPGESVAVGDPLLVLEVDGDDSTAVDQAVLELASHANSPADPPLVQPSTVNTEASQSVGDEDEYAQEVPPRGDVDSPSSERVFSSPIARKLAKQAELDINEINGSGPSGRIMRRDVESTLKNLQMSEPSDPALPLEGRHPTPPSRMRAAIARRLTEAKSTIPHFYVHGSASVQSLQDYRAKLNRVLEINVSLNDLLIRAAGIALSEFPAMNRTWTNDGIMQYDGADLAVAIAIPDGLVTPVLRGVESKPIGTINREVRDFSARAHQGSLKQQELVGGTMSVSNLGMYGVESFTAIINPPHASILAVGAARKVPTVFDEVVTIDTRIEYVLSADHRVIDGADAAKWLGRLQQLLENPLALLA